MCVVFCQCDAGWYWGCVSVSLMWGGIGYALCSVSMMWDGVEYVFCQCDVGCC